MAVALGGVLGASALLSPLLPALLAAVGAASAALMALPLRPIAFLHALIVAIPFSAALPRGAFVPFVVPSELLLIVTVCLALVHAALSRRLPAVPPALLGAAAVFAVGTSLVPLAGYLVRGVALQSTDVLNLVAPVQYLVLFGLCAAVPASARERRQLVHTMIASATAVGAIGLLQAAEVGPVVGWLQASYPSEQAAVSQEAGRVTSVFGAWNALGLFLVTALLLIASISPDQRRAHGRVWLGLATIVTLLCLLATNLWSGMIGVVLGYAFIKTYDPRGLRSVAPLAALVAVGVVLLLPDLTQRVAFQARADTWLPQTLVFRWGVWQDVFVPRIAENPLWGVRPSFAGLAWPYPESQYIGYLYRSGAVSLLAHVVWLLVTVAWLLRALRRPQADPLQRSLVLASLSLALVLSLIGIINPVFTYSGTMDYFWIVLGLVVNGGRLPSHADP